jgi:hypothetical protein
LEKGDILPYTGKGQVERNFILIRQNEEIMRFLKKIVAQKRVALAYAVEAVFNSFKISSIK